MAKFRFLYVLLLIIVVLSAFASAQQQQQQNKRRRPNQQATRQRKPNNNNRPNRVNTGNRVVNKVVKKNVEKPVKLVKGQVNHQIPGLGAVRGRTIKSEWSGQKIMQFFDIPYAKSPVGAMRFKAAVPVTHWTGVYNAEKPHHGCPSLEDVLDYEVLKSKNIDVEDCLRLSISTKSLTDNAPVMVYIHGDFLYDGTSMQAAPGYLLEEDIVLVSIRYRLGPFGFLSTMTEDIPGNAAVYDVITALKWIQEHISSFGGDAKRITLFGQVAGAALINVLTMSPAVPEGLFHRVIYHSASALSPAFITDNPLPAAKDIGKFAGCKNVNKVEALNKCLRRLNATELLEAFTMHGSSKTGQGVGSSGGAQFVVGGPSGILPQFPAKLLTSGNFKAYPTMGGSPKNSGTAVLKDIFIDNFNETIIDDQMDTNEYIKHIISETNGADPTGAWRTYAEEEVFTPKQMKNGTFYSLIPGLVDLTSTICFKNPVLLAMQGNAKKLPNNTYLYTFDYDGELNHYSITEDDNSFMPFELGVSLTDENLYLFPWPRYSLVNNNRDIKIAKRMVALWTSFAATGKPTAPNMPPWPPMTKETGPYMKLGKTVSVGKTYIDEFNAAIRETNMGYSLVNDEFFESLVEIKKGNDVDSDDDEEDGNAVDSNGTGRGNVVLIAHRHKF